MDWILGGNPKNQGAFWYAAARVAQLMDDGMTPELAYTHLLDGSDALIRKAKEVK